ncbi:MAG: Hsp20/alpha crystallin family protein [Spirochaetaceae bacterium]|jgi:HSP20 family molecular chaperone IbpA|nr:Hsp20/alpha crystallin family protein [Spirochaetaceae bacterium]
MKTLSLYHPFDMEKPLMDMERFVDSFFGEGARALGRNFVRFPAVDVMETNDSYVVEAELPGYEEKDIEVNVDNNTLTIESKSDAENEKTDAEHQYVIRERRRSQFSRSFRLPENADTDTVNAGFNNGLLRLEIKKRAEAKKRVIQIGK